MLSLVAIGTSGAAISRGCGSSRRGVDVSLLVRVLPENAGTVRGLSWESLRRTALGRRFADGLREETLSELTARSCGVKLEEVVRWLVRMTEPGRLASGVTVAGLSWSEERVNGCARKLARDRGATLDIRRQGRLRAYVVGDYAQWAAWLNDSTAMIAGAWGGEEQRSTLASIVDREQPAGADTALTQALRRVDTGASFWLAIRRPSPPDRDDPDLDLGGSDELDRWYDERVSGVLGTRPDALFLSLDIGSQLTVRGGAVYGGETAARRAADHLRALLSDHRAHAVGTLDLDRLDPRMRGDLQRRFRESTRRAAGIESLLAERGHVTVSGAVVTFRASIGGDDLDALVGADTPRELLDRFNQLLPTDLSLRL